MNYGRPGIFRAPGTRDPINIPTLDRHLAPESPDLQCLQGCFCPHTCPSSHQTFT